jgi:mannose-6-phosphate isomerase-like protein (cupin superfamily)
MVADIANSVLICYNFHMSIDQFPDSEPKIEVENAVLAWKKFLLEADLQALLDTAKEPEETDDGTIYEVETPEDLPGDFAIVDMRKVDVDTPHYHDNGEVEVHLSLAGTARMCIEEDELALGPGSVVIVESGMPHCVKPDDEYIVGVLSLPGYTEENQIPIDVNQNPESYVSQFYLAAQAE